MKLQVFKGRLLDEKEPYWIWMCPSIACYHKRNWHGATMFWENAIRGASNHIKWHQQVKNAKI